MFNRLRPPGRNGDKTKGTTGKAAASGTPDRGVEPSQPRAEPPRNEPPRLELPRHRSSPFKASHLKSVEGNQVPGQPAGPAGPGEPRPVAQSNPRPLVETKAQPVSQPVPKSIPARPAIPPYPVSGARAAQLPGAEVQSFGRLMLVGPRIRLNGEIRACERLVVQGVVEGEVSETERLEVARGGHFRGAAQVESCMVDGVFEGELEVRGVLTLKANGRVAGTVRYGEIEIERGGVIAGTFGARAAAEGRAAFPATSGGPRSA